MDEYLDKWRLANPEKIAATHTSEVYKVQDHNDNVLILKCFNEIGIKDEAGGSILLEYYGAKGAINLIAFDEKAQLLEYAEGEELSELVKNGDDKKATKIVCDVIKDLHKERSIEFPKTLIPLKEWFKDLFVAADKDGDEMLVLAAKVAEDLLLTTKTSIPLHGDIHHHNIIKAKRGWLAIDPKGLIGDPCYDVANIYGNPEGMHTLWHSIDRIDMLTQIFSENLGYPRERLLKFSFVHNAISSIWSGATSVDRQARFELAKLIYSRL